MLEFAIVVVSTDAEFVERVTELGAQARCVDIEKVDRAETAFVSPANSLGFMDGGIDAAYMRMFPGVQQRVRSRIASLGHLTGLGRPYLRVGSALVVPAGPSTCLVSAPTMFLPHDVSATRNAYHACMAALMAFRKYRTRVRPFATLVLPGMCIGWGKMTRAEAAAQMRAAISDFENGLIPIECPESSDLPDVVLNESRDAEQPRNYDNREIHENTQKVPRPRL